MRSGKTRFDRGGVVRMSDIVSRRVIYHGRVQGVGFRATTSRLARGFRVEGYVRNQSDGTVELAVRGEPEELERFLAAVSAHFADNISQLEDAGLAQAFSEKGFKIKY